MTEPATEHGFYRRDSFLQLPPRTWPGGMPVAIAFVVSAETYDLYPPGSAFTPPNVPGGFGRAPYPDYRAFSMREYGNRVGIFRIMDLLEQFGFRASLAADRSVALSRREVVERALESGWDLIGHGISLTEVISEAMSEEEEREYIRSALAPLRAFGRPVTGWHGIEYAQSSRTPRLLREEGISYHLDWPHDERPVPMSTAAGAILSLPMSADLDDVMAHWHRKIGMQRWVQSVLDAVDQLAAEGATGGRLLVLNLHPWLLGQPYRSTYLAELLPALAGRKDVWMTTTDAIVSHLASDPARELA